MSYRGLNGPLSWWERRALDLIEAAADDGRRAPTGDDLQDHCGCASIGTTVTLVRRLEARGLIAVERFQRGRRMTILATGRKTAPMTNQTPHWRAAPRPRSTPAPTLSHVRQRRPGLARQILVAAKHEGLSMQDFLAELVWSGWQARSAALAAASEALVQGDAA